MVELLAPAGSFENLQAAINAGCDSVYFGIKGINMRSGARADFTLENMGKVISRCHKAGVKAYLTLNTIIYDHDLTIVKTLITKAKAANISAIIAMDQAVISMARQAEVEVHISTQINITNIETLKFYAMFADTIVLSRELIELYQWVYLLLK